MREAAVASSTRPSGFFTCSSPIGAQHMTLPFPALRRPLSSQAMAPDCAGGSPARRFSSAARVRLPMSFGRVANHFRYPRATSSRSSLRAETIDRSKASISSMSSVGSPAAQMPPPVISRGAVPTSAAVLFSCGAPSASPAAAPSSVPRKRDFSSSCCCVIAFGCFLRTFGSGRNEPMTSPPAISLLLSPELGFGELQAVVAPEAPLADEERGDAEDAAGQRQVRVPPQAVLDVLLLRGGEDLLARKPRLRQ